jgi:hypothetical protein
LIIAIQLRSQTLFFRGPPPCPTTPEGGPVVPLRGGPLAPGARPPPFVECPTVEAEALVQGRAGDSRSPPSGPPPTGGGGGGGERKQRKEHFTQDDLIDMVKLAYTPNEEGKGKTRERALEEELAIIRDKEAYFAYPNN